MHLAGALVASRTYDPGMRLQQTAFGNGLVESRTYRADDKLATIDLPGVHGLSYGYDANKWKTAEQVTTNPAENQIFGYDFEGRLTSWTRGSGANQTWNLSPVGDWNDTSRDGAIETRTHSPAHAITSVNATPVIHDLKGNLTQDDRGSQYTWDFENRLLEARRFHRPAVPVRFFYDALGRRLGKTVGAASTVFVHDDQQVAAEYDDGVLVRRYVYGTYVDEPLALITAGGTFYYAQNHVYSAVAITNSAGDVVERYRYDAYGGLTPTDPSGFPRAVSLVDNATGFTGRYHDADSGLVEFRNRQYDTRLGRFINRDLAYHYLEGLSLYGAYFVPNAMDPTGDQSVEQAPSRMPTPTGFTGKPADDYWNRPRSMPWEQPWENRDMLQKFGGEAAREPQVEALTAALAEPKKPGLYVIGSFLDIGFAIERGPPPVRADVSAGLALRELLREVGGRGGTHRGTT